MTSAVLEKNIATNDFTSKISEIIPIWYWLMLLLTILIPRLMLLNIPPGRDQETAAVAADMINHGAAPYKDFIILRGPAFLAIEAASLKTFGHNIAAINIPDLFCWSVTAVLIVLIANLLWNRRTSMFCGYLIAFLCAAPNVIGYYNRGQPEEWIGLGWTFAAYHLIKAAINKNSISWHSMLVGVGVGFAFLIKTNGLLGIVSLTVSLFIINSNRSLFYKQLFLSLLGITSVTLPFIVWLIAKGSLNSAYETLFKLALDYTSVIGHNTIIGLGRALFGLAGSLPFIGWLITILSWGGLYNSINSSETRKIWLIPAMFWLTGILSVAIQTHLNYHLLLLIPFIALFGGRGLDLIIKRPSVCLLNKFRVFAWCAAFMAIIFQSSTHMSLLFKYAQNKMGKLTNSEYLRFMSDRQWPNTFAEADDPLGQIQVGEYVKEHSVSGDKIEVWDSTGLIYFTSEKMPATPHLWHQFIIYPHKNSLLNNNVGPSAPTTFLQELNISKPKFLVIRAGDKNANPWQFADSLPLFLNINGITDFLRVNYIIDKQFPMDIGGYILYRRKDLKK